MVPRMKHWTRPSHSQKKFYASVSWTVACFSMIAAAVVASDFDFVPVPKGDWIVRIIAPAPGGVVPYGGEGVYTQIIFQVFGCSPRSVISVQSGPIASIGVIEDLPCTNQHRYEHQALETDHPGLSLVRVSLISEEGQILAHDQIEFEVNSEHLANNQSTATLFSDRSVKEAAQGPHNKGFVVGGSGVRLSDFSKDFMHFWADCVLGQGSAGLVRDAGLDGFDLLGMDAGKIAEVLQLHQEQGRAVNYLLQEERVISGAHIRCARGFFLATIVPRNTLSLAEEYLSFFRDAVLNTLYLSYSSYIDGSGMPSDGPILTLVGKRRLDHLVAVISTVVQEDIKGDVIETGVWRGGAMFLAAKTLQVLGESRRVYLCDSFGFGIPPPPEEGVYNHQDSEAWRLEYLKEAELHLVQRDAERFGLNMSQLTFVRGFFNETLPQLARDLPELQLSVLRLDGDTYFSTMDALEALYPKLQPGGFVIVDDYTDWEGCRNAVLDFRKKYHLEEPVVFVPHRPGEEIRGVYWRKGPVAQGSNICLGDGRRNICSSNNGGEGKCAHDKNVVRLRGSMNPNIPIPVQRGDELARVCDLGEHPWDVGTLKDWNGVPLHMCVDFIPGPVAVKVGR